MPTPQAWGNLKLFVGVSNEIKTYERIMRRREAVPSVQPRASCRSNVNYRETTAVPTPAGTHIVKPVNSLAVDHLCHFHGDVTWNTLVREYERFVGSNATHTPMRKPRIEYLHAK
jgi:hypothetical protein